MRINVYAEELTDEVEIVHKEPSNHTVKFVGVRMYLKSPDALQCWGG